MTILYCILSFLAGVGLTLAITIWLMKRKAVKMTKRMMETFSSGLFDNFIMNRPDSNTTNTNSYADIVRSELSKLNLKENPVVINMAPNDTKITDESGKNF